jgi:hypothetical protein
MTDNKPTGKQLLALVGNPDVYAVQHKDGSWHPVREELTAKVIRAHRSGEVTVGTYIVRPPDQARTLVFDIDAKTDKEQDTMLNAVCKVLAELDARSEDELSWGVEFSGRKGYHVWVVSDEYIDASVLYRLGRGVREEAGYPALEVFPKQTEVRDLGNLVKLPGGVHAVTGNENNFVGAVPAPTPAALLTQLSELYPDVGLRKRKGEAPEVIEYPCVHDIQGGVKEGGRNIHLFHLAVMLRRWSLSDDNIETVIQRANERSVDGPLDAQEVESILENSRYSGPICNQLDDDVHCGEQCIIARHTGLYTRPGALKWAGVGEVVTVEVASRTEEGTMVELSHPDMVQGRAVLAEGGK